MFEGWSSGAREGLSKVQGPDNEAAVWLGEFDGVKPTTAIEKAWAIALPGFAREIKSSQTPPPSDGWDAIVVTFYKSTPAEGRIVQAIARAKGPRVYVSLIDGKLAAIQRRGAQINQIIQSYSPAELKTESFAGKTAKRWSPKISKQLDQFMSHAMTEFRVPGAAIAIVQDDEVVFEKGYGLTAKDGQPITPETLFMIGSVSKSLTTLVATRLIHQGKLSWDTPMTKLLPGFRLTDETLMNRINLDHAFCACTGLPRQDLEFIFEYAGIDTQKRLAELASMKPTTKFRETFQYSNALVSAGGFALAHADMGKRGRRIPHDASERSWTP